MLTLVVANMLLARTAAAGATQVGLSCRSKDGALAIEGSVPGDAAEFSVTLTVQGRRLDLRSDDGLTITSFDFIDDSVFAFSIKPPQSYAPYLRLYALPKTMTRKGSKRANQVTAKFDAMLQASNPSAPLDFSKALFDQRVSCEYKYSL